MTFRAFFMVAGVAAACGGCLSIPENIRAELQAQPAAQNHFDPTGKGAPAPMSVPVPASAAPSAAAVAP